jgi:hypothetical protein
MTKGPGGDQHRMWRTRTRVAANALLAGVVVVVTIGNAFAGQWVYVALGVAVVACFGILPASSAWKAGAFLSGEPPTHGSD